MASFSILITTKNRLEDLKYTLYQIEHLIKRDDVECVICDDGSKDGTADFITEHHPNIQLLKNKTSKGLIFSRNRMMDLVSSDYAISLDDDAHFISKNVLEDINSFFNKNLKCGVQAFRIFWSLQKPTHTQTIDKPQRVRSFVGCGHVWRMEAWRSIPKYPEWFVFYGEEEFASYQLFKNNWEIHYLPQVLVHHRVDIKSRKKDKDYRIRLRCSLRSGWYLYFLFFPLKIIPKRFVYTIWIQFKTKVLKGDILAFIAIIQALLDVFINSPRLIKNSNRFSKREFLSYSKLPASKLYWAPKDL